MTDFIRAVTEDQKAVRREEVKKAAAGQFESSSLFDVTITSVTKELGWTRSNFYKYYPSISAVLADIWIDRMSDSCRSFNERLEHVNKCTPANYAEIAYHAYFTGDVLRYITIQPILAENSDAVGRMSVYRIAYSQWASAHRELLMSRLDVSREYADRIYLETYRVAVSLYNIERTELLMNPSLGPRYNAYIRIRFVKAVTALTLQSQEYSRKPETDPKGVLSEEFKRIFPEIPRN